MGSRKLIRDLFLSERMLSLHQTQSLQAAYSRSICAPGVSASRRFSVFNEFSKQFKGQANSNPEFQKTIKDLKEKAGGLKEVKEELKVRTKQTTEQLYKRVDDVWTEAESQAKKVSANLKEKISAATEEVKDSLGLGKEPPSGSSSTVGKKNGSHAASGEEKAQFSDASTSQETQEASETLFSRFRQTVCSSTQATGAFQKLKDASFVELAKKGFEIINEELNGNPTKRKHMQRAAATSANGQRSTATDIVLVPKKQSQWEAFKEKVQAHPIFKRINGISEPVVTKGQEIAEDMRERWETSDHPVVHKIQDLNETVFGETAAATAYREIHLRDPSFSLPEFLAEVQEMISPTLNAYLKGDAEVLKKNCFPEVIERCLAERRAYVSQGIFFDNKILHISDAEVVEQKLMGSTPVIIIMFRTQQVYCVRDSYGAITDGGRDTIHAVIYVWAMQLMDAEELGEDVFYPMWRLREMQQMGIQALI
ncbi:mitochondrial import inner membrane translocase subunit TIM44-2 [Amborella trichopoda]|uniref:Tim44-like domain-containing protein n=1 Tax=Amborella trichopoda TaxID=13333 RepID=U5DEB7_AMBTC|nr:mitochondrial import inner membrane translocase subunit TIM44-2 [Amborella trichopoda]ERN18748.1 hypothetical protein AMTR_s00067p00028100 [Amborella trichopoda]|eukprot:XP_006857281.1 mitochondrial import inner membrane translocase subunit TIM44-2 [Amborella trichopoda]